MIFFVAPTDELWEMEEYLHQFGAHLLNRITLVRYDDITAGKPLPAGTYVFSAIDRLFPAERGIAARFCDELCRADPEVKLINHPGRVLCRCDLLKKCFALKRNSFRIFRVHEFHRCKKFPVFIRPEGEHTGSMTRLLYTRRELTRELVNASILGYRLRDLLIVEYCDTADTSGIFRLYCATIVGNEIIPQIIIHNRNWIAKWDGRLVDEEKEREIRDYVEANPHATWLKESFELARINYGRMDYGLLNGVPHLWEINTNPTIVRPVGSASGLTQEQRDLLEPTRNRFLRHLGVALEKLDGPANPTKTIRVEISETERRRVEVERELKFRLRARRTIFRRLEPAISWLRHPFEPRM